MNKQLERSRLIKNRLLQVIEQGEVMTHDEIEIVQKIAQHLGLSTKQKAANNMGISYNGLKQRIAKEQVMVVELNGITLIGT